MTKREQAKLFIENGTCSSSSHYIGCNECLFRKECGKHPDERCSICAPAIAKQWLRENPVKISEQVAELERQIAELKEEEYPYFFDFMGVPYIAVSKQNSYRIRDWHNDNSDVETISECRKLEGEYSFRDGKMLKTEEEN